MRAMLFADRWRHSFTACTFATVTRQCLDSDDLIRNMQILCMRARHAARAWHVTEDYVACGARSQLDFWIPNLSIAKSTGRMLCPQPFVSRLIELLGCENGV